MANPIKYGPWLASGNCVKNYFELTHYPESKVLSAENRLRGAFVSALSTYSSSGVSRSRTLN